LLAGATGLVGRALLTQLLNRPECGRIHALLRRAAPGIESHPKLRLLTVNFAQLPALPPADDVYIALGTTIKVAGSQAAFRQVDFDFAYATARAARAAGAQRLALVSAMGADPLSRVFYNRVKGELEEAVSHLGYTSVSIARPSLLVGDRASLGQPLRSGESWALRLAGPLMGWMPRGLRPIAARDVAAALIEATAAGRPGVQRLPSAEMQGAERR
jgi:uncharacterized protein YbjT (DUF2867 family)